MHVLSCLLSRRRSQPSPMRWTTNKQREFGPNQKCSYLNRHFVTVWFPCLVFLQFSDLHKPVINDGGGAKPLYQNVSYSSRLPLFPSCFLAAQACTYYVYNQVWFIPHICVQTFQTTNITWFLNTYLFRHNMNVIVHFRLSRAKTPWQGRFIRLPSSTNTM